MILNDIAGVLLDMDGTLVDSDAAVERAWTRWAGEHDIEPGLALAIAHGAWLRQRCAAYCQISTRRV